MLSQPMKDLITLLKHLGISRDDAIGIALLVWSDDETTDELNWFIMNRMKANKYPTSDEISEKALLLVGAQL